MIGRQDEVALLKRASSSNKAELGIIYGRRRVGKSTLLQSLQGKGDLYFEGVKGLSKKKQIKHFTQQLAEQTNTVPVDAKDWRDAFKALTQYIQKGRIFVVFDEVPWMASGQKELIGYIKYFWDNHWKSNSRLHLCLCGSIASYMVKHVIHSEALHNRKTYEFKLQALSIREAKDFFPKSNPDQILKYLLAFGGIPKYLEQVDPTESFQNNINRLCLKKNSFFTNEFDSVFKEQFKKVQTYSRIVHLLSEGRKNKEELAKSLKMSSGGGFTDYLNNLEIADFIHQFQSFSFEDSEHSKTRKFVLWDEWLRFYFSFIKSDQAKINLNSNANLFSSFSEGKLSQFFGISFEVLILKNIPHLLEILEISVGDVKNYGPFFRTSRTKADFGVQIYLLVEEENKTLNIIECKNSSNPIGIGIIKEIDEKIKSAQFPQGYFVRKILVTAGPVSADLKRSGYFAKIVHFQDFLN